MKLEVFEDRMYYDQFAIRPEGSRDFHDTIHFVRKVDALVAMRTIEKWIDQEREACAVHGNIVAEPLYTNPPRREWRGLTDEERMWIINRLEGQDWVYVVDAIEAKLKEKNSG